MKTITTNCPNCGAPTDLDIDNPQEFCSRCGSKLMLDLETVQELMIEKEKTRQVEIRESTKMEKQRLKNESEKEEREHKEKINKRRFIFASVWTVLSIIGGIIFTIVSEDNNSFDLFKVLTIWMVGMIFGMIFLDR